MKLLISVSLILLLFLVGISLAHEQSFSTITGNQILVDGKSIKAGVKPDSFLYNLDVGIDRIRYLLTFDNVAKSRLGLEIARERLMEVREMALENKIEAMQKAQQEHRKYLDNVKTAVGGISKANSTEEIEIETEIEREIEEHETEIETVNNELKIKIEIKGNITAEQQSLIDSILNSMQNKTGEVKIKIDNKKGETKIKIKQETGKSDDEVEEEVKRIEIKERLVDIRIEKALDRINDAKEEIQGVKEKLAIINITQINKTAVDELIDLAQSHLTKAETAFNETRYGEAFGQATAAEKLAENAERILEKVQKITEKLEEEREIEVEVEEGRAKVKVEIAGRKLKYMLLTTVKEEIITDIAEKTGLTPDEIKTIMKMKIEEEKEEIECTTDDDCVGKIVCPQVLGKDTPICKDDKCKCGSKRETIKPRVKEKIAEKKEEIKQSKSSEESGGLKEKSEEIKSKEPSRSSSSGTSIASSISKESED